MKINTEADLLELELSLRDRLLAQQFIPKGGNTIDMVLAKSLLRSIELSSEEINDYEITTSDDGSITWNAEKAKTKAVSLNPREVEFLKKAIETSTGEVSMSAIPDFFIDIINA